MPVQAQTQSRKFTGRTPEKAGSKTKLKLDFNFQLEDLRFIPLKNKPLRFEASNHSSSISNIPSFQYSILPIFQYSSIPLFHYSIIPLFHSNIPFQYSNIPLFHYSPKLIVSHARLHAVSKGRHVQETGNQQSANSLIR